MFELLRTAFKLAVANLTQNKLILCAVVVLLLMVLWSVLSLLFNNQVRMKKDCINIIRFLRANNISAGNYPKFVALWNNLPQSMKFEWKRYEVKKTGKPSDYLSKQECVDSYVFGGLQKQNRSLMRTIIGVTVVVIAVFSIAMIGVSTTTKSNAILTTVLVADSLIVPVITYILLMTNYYIYTAIRHQQYRSLVEVYYDFVDVLDEKVDIVDIFGKEGNTARLIASAYTNETVLALIEEAKRIRDIEIQTREVRVGRSSLSPLQGGVLGAVDVEDKTEENVVSNTIKTRNKLSESGEKQELAIMNERQFVKVVGEVEKLLSDLEKVKDGDKKSEMERRVNSMIKALTDYKQKAKSKKDED